MARGYSLPFCDVTCPHHSVMCIHFSFETFTRAKKLVGGWPYKLRRLSREK